MSIVDGLKVNAANSNAAWCSKTSDNTVTGKQTLNRSGSGAQVTDLQQEINDMKADIITNQGDITTIQSVNSDQNTDISNLQTLSGEADGSTTHSPFSGATIPDSSSTFAALQSLETAVEARIPSTEKGAANGVATLDAGSKIPVGQLPASVVGSVNYQGTWNASTNTPTLSDGTGSKGYYYVVSVAGSQDLGSGSITFDIGDWVVHNGSIYERLDDANVQSVNGQTGVVSLDTDDVAEGATNLYFTNTRADARADTRIAAASVDDLSDVDTTTSAPSTNEALIWDGSNWVPGLPPAVLIYSVTSKSAAYTAATSDNVILCDASGGAFTITTYTAVGNTGRVLTIKKTDSSTNAVTVDPNASETVDGGSTFSLDEQYNYIVLMSDGTNWVIVGGKYEEWTRFRLSFGNVNNGSATASTIPAFTSQIGNNTGLLTSSGTQLIAAYDLDVTAQLSGDTSTSSAAIWISHSHDSINPLLSGNVNAAGLGAPRGAHYSTRMKKNDYLQFYSYQSFTSLTAYVSARRRI